MNFFVYKNVAERYARYRPYFHPLVIAKIRAYLQLQGPIGVALDVGCGTGQSTFALKEIADLVLGMDLSAEMLQVAERNVGVQYIQAAAEKLAIRNQLCDLLTTSLAYHWFDQERFFAEARRALKQDAWLIISNNWFTGQMKNEPSFEQWFVDIYEQHYPSPQRNSLPMTSEFAQEHGFDFVHQETYQNEVPFTEEELAAYLITQSNVIAATERGNEKLDDVYEWLISQAKPFFKSEKSIFLFGGYIWYMQKTSWPSHGCL